MAQFSERARRIALAATLVALVSSAFAAAPAPASAQGGFYIGLGVGGGININNWRHQLRTEQDFGWHFTRRPHGFFIAAAFSQSFLNASYLLTFAPRFGFDIVVLRRRKMDLILTPNGTVPGFAFGDPNVNDPDDNPDAFFHMTYNFDVKLLFGRGIFGIYFRPVGFEIGIGNYVFVRYHAMFGFLINP